MKAVSAGLVTMLQRNGGWPITLGYFPWAVRSIVAPAPRMHIRRRFSRDRLA